VSDAAGTLRADERAQRVLDALLAPGRPGLASRVRRFRLARQKRAMIAAGDPAVRYRLDGYDLLMPLSHLLPHIRRTYPDYSKNVGRIAARVFAAHPAGRMIDVGANIGDTVAIVRSAGVKAPIVCVEGEPGFLRVLEANLARGLGDGVTIERCFAGESEGEVAGAIKALEGTASIVGDAGGAKIGVRTVDAIAAAHPGGPVRLLKVDTDGFDAKVIRGAMGVIGRDRPAVFFEYDPDLMARAGDDGRDLLRSLARAGYGTIAAYDNNGRYLLHASASNESLWNDLHVYFAGRGGAAYMDLCAFHASDAAIADALVNEELAINARGGAPQPG
jgi:FkbM family methyltransferase